MTNNAKGWLVVVLLAMAVGLHLSCCWWVDKWKIPWSQTNGLPLAEYVSRGLFHVGNTAVLTRNWLDHNLAIGIGCVVPVLLVIQAIVVLFLRSDRPTSSPPA